MVLIAFCGHCAKTLALNASPMTSPMLLFMLISL
jgi:hypothetical protein